MNIVYYPGMRCYDSNLLAALQLKGKACIPFFLHCFDLKFNENEAGGIACDYGIKSTLLSNCALFKEKENKVDEKLFGSGNSFFQVEVDIYNIPWHPRYHKDHGNHFILYVNQTVNEVEVRDPMCVKGIQKFSINDFFKMVNAVEGFDINKVTIPTEIALPSVKENDLYKWIDYVECNDIFDALIGIEEDSYNVKLYKTLWEIAYGRSLYGEYYCATHEKHSIDEFKSLTAKWLRVRSVLVQEYLHRTRRKEKVLFEVRDAITTEINLLKSLKR